MTGSDTGTAPDLVITDIRIPGMDGLSMIEAAKEFCEDTVFVVISGYTEFEYARKALRLGVKGYIDKPISIDKLNDVLNFVEKDCFQTKEEQQLLTMSRELTKELNIITETASKVWWKKMQVHFLNIRIRLWKN